MDWKAFKSRLIAVHAGKLQEIASLEHGIAEIRHGLEQLSRLGHNFYLAEGTAPELEKFPKIMFHVTAAPNGRLVNSVYDLADLGEGWFDTAEEAQFWDGLTTQFAGRGGIARNGLPAIQNLPTLEDIIKFAKKQKEEKARIIAEFKAQRAKEQQNAK